MKKKGSGQSSFFYMDSSIREDWDGGKVKEVPYNHSGLVLHLQFE
jgi:hypothetical protein